MARAIVHDYDYVYVNVNVDVSVNAEIRRVGWVEQRETQHSGSGRNKKSRLGRATRNPTFWEAEEQVGLGFSTQPTAEG